MKNQSPRGTQDRPCFSLVLQEPYHTAMELGLPKLELFRCTGLDEGALADPYTVIGRHQALAFYQHLGWETRLEGNSLTHRFTEDYPLGGSTTILYGPGADSDAAGTGELSEDTG